MPRKLHRKIKRTYIFKPQYDRTSFIKYSNSVPIMKAIDVQIRNYINEMYEVFENLMLLSEEEIRDCLDIPEKVIHRKK